MLFKKSQRRENTFTVLYIFIGKNPHISGPVQFKFVVFKGQLQSRDSEYTNWTMARPYMTIRTPTHNLCSNQARTLDSSMTVCFPIFCLFPTQDQVEKAKYASPTQLLRCPASSQSASSFPMLILSNQSIFETFPQPLFFTLSFPTPLTTLESARWK